MRDLPAQKLNWAWLFYSSQHPPTEHRPARKLPNKLQLKISAGYPISIKTLQTNRKYRYNVNFAVLTSPAAWFFGFQLSKSARFFA
jgi:hypothetical protein